MPKTKLKKYPFTLIEILIVISLVVTIGGIFTLKGSQFLKNFKRSQETALICHSLDQFYLLAQIEQKPITIAFRKKNDGFELLQKDYSFKKKFSELKMKEVSCDVVIYPLVAPRIESIYFLVEGQIKKLNFNKKKLKFSIDPLTAN